MNAFTHPVRLGRFIPSSRRGLPLRSTGRKRLAAALCNSLRAAALYSHCAYIMRAKAARLFCVRPQFRAVFSVEKDS
jgi:hypothetical protein